MPPRLLAHWICLIVFCSAASCGPPVAKPLPPTTAQPPTLRLPRTVLPTSYEAALTVTPAAETFTGRITVYADVAAATDVFWLNAERLTISAARVRRGTAVEAASGAAGGDPGAALEVITAPSDFVGFRAARPLAPGPVIIDIEYSGLIEATDTVGMFRQLMDERWYVFTQFEATDARRVFPCFDEPDSKVPWTLTLNVPRGEVALSNEAAASTRTEGDRDVVTFNPTKPLPTYLLAFAVGSFDIVEGGVSDMGVPLRVITPRGHAGEAGWAVESTLPLLGMLEGYFGSRYPYAKLDSLAIPHTVNFGAMEHPGLITYSQSLILSKPEELSYQRQRNYAYTAAHELAHQWFGNLVTPGWWDDIWLNESFATWMEAKIVGQWRPAWEPAVYRADNLAAALGADSLDSARRIRQPIISKDDIHGAFDGISYSKGAAVIDMFEAWLGPERFRAGIRLYLDRHSWGNATAADFLAALGDAAGADVATPFSTFLDQSGAPLVSMSLTCAPGQAPAVSLAQERYRPLGSPASEERRWQLPVCVRYAYSGVEARQCTLLTEARQEVVLEAATSCPDWIAPNADHVGYYHARLEGSLLGKLLASGLPRLSLGERLGLVADAQALVLSGHLDLRATLAMVPRLAVDPSAHVVITAAGMSAIGEEDIAAAQRGIYARFVGDHFGAKAKALGWSAKPGDSDETKMLRSAVIGLMVNAGDAALVAEAKALAARWLTDPTAISPDMVSQVLSVASRHGDRAWFDALRAEAAATSAIDRRRRLLGAMGQFTDPEIAADALALVLTDAFDIRESMSLLWGALGHASTRGLAYRFATESWDALLAKIPRDTSAALIWIGVAQCDAERRDEIVAFMAPRVTPLPGGERMVAQATEALDLCILHQRRNRDSVAAFLADYGK